MPTIKNTYIAHAPGHRTLLAGGGCLIRLALDAQVHDVIAANRTVVHDNVPGPQSDGVPLRTQISTLEHYISAYENKLSLPNCNNTVHWVCEVM